jgi:hypothetical protein
LGLSGDSGRHPINKITKTIPVMTHRFVLIILQFL